MTHINIIDLGVIPYAEAWKAQTSIHEACLSGTGESTICVLEHHPVITLGKHAGLNFLHLPEEMKASVELVHTDRGGNITAHMPGQVVIYPIIDFRKFPLGPKGFVALLESSVIGVLSEYSIQASRDPEHPGVWVGTNKICALGIRIKEKISMHGLALNVNNDLSLFSLMTPCGIENRGVTSMKGHLQKELPISQIKKELAERIRQGLVCGLGG